MTEGIDDDWWERPSPARMYDYLLGGSANFAADREFAAEALRTYPDTRLIARANRSFLRRSVRFCVAAGIRQFLDLGSGVPTVGNVHEIAQAAAPESRIVYVDKDPVATTHARRLLGATADVGVVAADLRDVASVLDAADGTRLIRRDEPVAILAVAVLHYLSDADDPAAVIAAYRDAFRSGGYLVVSHGTDDQVRELTELGALFARSTDRARLRTRAEVAALLGGLPLVEPGLVYTAQWRPDAESELPDGVDPARSANYAAVARFAPAG